MCDERDWSGLPIELINLISKKLPKRSDFVKFRAVCKTWCSYTPLSDYPPQFPWLIEHIPGTHLVNGLRFYSSFSSETGTIFRKEFNHGTNCMRPGPSHGTLILNDRSISTHSYVLFNPLTNEEIRLPFLHFSGHPYLVWTGTNSIHNQDVIVIEQQYFPTKNDSLAFYDRDNN
ncbi:F-box protein [Carex littledalei]|uniref:F-box protein n=1 Tax=Carex littledalei TaxID=544730 RepID=A0A833RLC8_9POAL|nr:F-box protein [Carex littledalei]